jgi:hypothetical protein
MSGDTVGGGGACPMEGGIFFLHVCLLLFFEYENNVFQKSLCCNWETQFKFA